MAALGRKSTQPPLPAGPVADPLQESDPWSVVGPKGKAVPAADEPGEDLPWPLQGSMGSLEHQPPQIMNETKVSNTFSPIIEEEAEDIDAQPAPESTSSTSSWLQAESSFDSYWEQSMRELEAFRDSIDEEERAKDAAREATLQANGIEAKRLRAAERRKERLLAEALKNSSKMKEELAQKHAAAAEAKAAKEKTKILIGSRTGCACPAHGQPEDWVISTQAAQAAIAGAMPRRCGSSGPEGPGFIRLPEV